MSRRHLLVSCLVALLCGGILVLFTDIERSVGRWLPGAGSGVTPERPAGGR